MTTTQLVAKINRLIKRETRSEDRIAEAAIRAYNKGVPMARVAKAIGMKPNRLYYIVNKYSKGK